MTETTEIYHAKANGFTLVFVGPEYPDNSYLLLTLTAIYLGFPADAMSIYF